jgi:hypothetical protein
LGSEYLKNIKLLKKMQHFLRKTCSKFGDWACSGSEEVEKVKTIGIYR